jgi:hypothetical protein
MEREKFWELGRSAPASGTTSDLAAVDLPYCGDITRHVTIPDVVILPDPGRQL